VLIDGAAAGDFSGWMVAGAGDVNGDGVDDLLIGARSADNNGRNLSGSSYVVFGGVTGPVDLQTLGTRGFRIDGAAAGDQSGASVAPAGDVNGDGLEDLLIGAPYADKNGNNSGASYVVFGSSSTTPVDLAALGTRGFAIDGAAAGDQCGFSVASAGDVNGDGTADVVIGARYADNNGRIASGSSYVVFGSSATTKVDLSALGTRGFRIDGAAAGDHSGSAVAGIADFNGDGLGDVLIGSPAADNNGRNSSGSAYVVHGAVATTPVDLGTLGGRGFRIDGAAATDSTGWAVASAGDVNGDGADDLIVGAPFASNNGRIYSGAIHVVFGGATGTLDLQTPGDRGLRIDGAAPGDNSGRAVAGAGDINGDGLDDLAFGAPYADNNGRDSSGSAYLVYGGATGPVDLQTLGNRGLRADGAAVGDFAGWSVAGAGDINGDDGDDVVVGAPAADNNARDNSGSAYALLGIPPPRPPASPPAKPAATLKVKARKKAKRIKRKARTKLVRKISVGPDQRARVKVTVKPKKARKTVKVKKTNRRVIVRTKKAPTKLRKKTRIRVRIISRGPGYTPTKWVRTWRVR
jgi:hypothetical protein